MFLVVVKIVSVFTVIAVDEAFRNIKAESRTSLEHSRTVIGSLTEELQVEYKTIENARLLYEKDVAQAEETGTAPPPPGENVDLRTADELSEELNVQQANLDMNLNTNPGVVEQYEKRKRDVSF